MSGCGDEADNQADDATQKTSEVDVTNVPNQQDVATAEHVPDAIEEEAVVIQTAEVVPEVKTEKAPEPQADDTPKPPAADKTEEVAESKPKVESLPEMALGKVDAPVVMINYSALTCNHCAEFHEKVLPIIKEKYIEPGLVRVIFRDFPGDQLSLMAHQLAWCRGEIKYMDFVHLLYSTQEKWLLDPDPVGAMKAIALQNGITAEQYKACIEDNEVLDRIVQTRLEGQKKYNISATPTIIINAKIHDHALSLEEFEEIVRPLLEPVLEKEVVQNG